MVDDGSVDGSAEILRAWADRRPGLVTRGHARTTPGRPPRATPASSTRPGSGCRSPTPTTCCRRATSRTSTGFLASTPRRDLVATNRWIWIEDDRPGRRTPTRCATCSSATGSSTWSPTGTTSRAAPRPRSSGATARGERGLRFDGRMRAGLRGRALHAALPAHLDRPKAGFLEVGAVPLPQAPDDLHPGRLAAAPGALRPDARARLPRRRPPGPRAPRHGAHAGCRPTWSTTCRGTSPSPTPGPRRRSRSAAPPPSAPRADRARSSATSTSTTPSPHSLVPIAAHVPRYVLQHGYADAAVARAVRAAHRPRPSTSSWCRRRTSSPVSSPTRSSSSTGEPAQPKHAKTVELQPTPAGRLLRRRILWVPANRKLELRLDGERHGRRLPAAHVPGHAATPGAMRCHLGETAGRARPRGRAAAPLEPTAKEGRRAPARCALPQAGPAPLPPTPGC